MGNYTYTIHFLKGSQSYIEQELLEKYPRFEIIMTEKEKIVFNYDEKDIEEFRNLQTQSKDMKGDYFQRYLLLKESIKEI